MSLSLWYLGGCETWWDPLNQTAQWGNNMTEGGRFQQELTERVSVCSQLAVSWCHDLTASLSH